MLCDLVHAEAADEKATRLRSALSTLGEGVVGKALSGRAIEDPYRYVSGKPGRYDYHIAIDTDGSEASAVELHSPLKGQVDGRKYWTVTIGERFIEEWVADGKGNVHLIAQTDNDSGYRVELSPHLLLPAGALPGQQWKVNSKLSVYDVSDLDTIAYEGSLISNKIYEGRYAVTTPAGKFDAVLISDEYEITVSEVNINDRRYTFYVENVGKVAEIDGFRVSAFILYNKDENRAKVLVSPPGNAVKP